MFGVRAVCAAAAIVAAGGAVLASADAPPAPGLQGGSTFKVAPVVVEFEDAVRRSLEQPAPLAPPEGPRLGPGTGEVEEGLRAIEEYERAYREAVAQGLQPPASRFMWDPAVDDWDAAVPGGPPSGVLTYEEAMRLPRNRLAGPRALVEGNDMVVLRQGETIDPRVGPTTPRDADGPKQRRPGTALPRGIDADPAGGTGPAAPARYQSWQAIDTTSRPSDSHCAVGDTHVGYIVNSSIAFYTKDGTERWTSTAASFFSTAPAGSDLFDPKIVYDQHNDRWLMLFLNGRRLAQTYYALAISRTDNPLGSWWVYYLRSDVDGSTDTALWADYPGLGYDGGDMTSGTQGGGVYITSNQYTAGDSFQYAKLRRLKKHELYNGQAVGWWDFWGFRNDDNTNIFTWKPASMDTFIIDTGTGTPVLYLFNSRAGGASWVTEYRLHDPLGSGPTLSGPTRIGVSSYSPPPAGTQSGGGANRLIDSNDCRTQDVQYRNFRVYFGVGDALDFGGDGDVEAVLHYFKINPGTNAVDWDTRFGADDFYYSYPAMKVDVDDDLHIAFSRTGDTEFPGIRVTGRLSTDGSTQGSALVRAGDALYDPSGSVVERWGDYNGLDVDCADDRKGAFLASQYARSTTRWGGFIAGTSFGHPPELHLNDGETGGFTSNERSYTWQLTSFDWSGVALYNQTGGDYDIAADDDCPSTSPYQQSTFGIDVRDFIVANGTQWGSDIHHAVVSKFGGTDGYRLQARSDSRDVTVGANSSDSFTNFDILDLFEVPLTAGKTYAATVTPSSGSADLDLFAFRGSRLHGRRADNDGSAQNAGAGATETLVFTAGESSTWGFAVLNENFATTNYNFKVWLRPLIASIRNQVDDDCDTYFGPTPSLLEGSTPVTWSLVTAPAGMTINSATGVVRWNNPAPGNWNVTIRATNPAGSDDEAFALRIDRCVSCPADLDGDGDADVNDFFLYLDLFAAGDPRADITGDGSVDVNDFFAYLDLFAQGC